MNNFYRMTDAVDPCSLMVQIRRNRSLWNQNRFRTEYPKTPHKDVSDIWLRFQEDPHNFNDVLDGKECVNYPAMWQLTGVRPIITSLMARVDGERLGRVMITSLPPGKTITPHRDEGDYAAYYDRFHVVLQGLPGSTMRCGTEMVQMQTGEVWWFDNKTEHEVRNSSSDERIHLVIDIRTPYVHDFNAGRNSSADEEGAGAASEEALAAPGAA